MKHIAYLCLALILCSCVPINLSESQIQTAIAQTASVNQGQQATLSPTETWTPFTLPATRTQTQTAVISPTPLASCIPADAEQELGLVSKVVDGASIQVDINGIAQLIHYLGISAPDKKNPIAQQAYQANFDLTNNQVVTLFSDPSSKDDSARYVFVAEKFINYELIKQGVDNLVSAQSQLLCANQFTKALHHAQTSAVGLWAPTPTPPPVALLTAVAKNAASARQQGSAASRGSGTINFADGKCQRSGITFVTITGRVINNTPYSLYLLKLRGYIYDSAGKQINTSAWFVDSDLIAPGKSSTYQILVSDPNQAFKSCSIAIEDYTLR